MWERGASATVTAAELSPARYLVSVGGTLDEGACASLREVLMSLAGAEHPDIVVDLGNAALDDFDPVPTLVGAAAVARSSGGRMTVVTCDRRLRTMLSTDGRVAVERRLEGRSL